MASFLFSDSQQRYPLPAIRQWRARIVDREASHAGNDLISRLASASSLLRSSNSADYILNERKLILGTPPVFGELSDNTRTQDRKFLAFDKRGRTIQLCPRAGQAREQRIQLGNEAALFGQTGKGDLESSEARKWNGELSCPSRNFLCLMEHLWRSQDVCQPRRIAVLSVWSEQRDMPLKNERLIVFDKGGDAK
jgi:hypothetical protein